MTKTNFTTIDGFDAVIVNNGGFLSGYIEIDTADVADVSDIAVLGGVTLFECDRIGLDFEHGWIVNKLSAGLMKSQLNLLSSYL